MGEVRPDTTRPQTRAWHRAIAPAHRHAPARERDELRDGLQARAQVLEESRGGSCAPGPGAPGVNLTGSAASWPRSAAELARKTLPVHHSSLAAGAPA